MRATTDHVTEYVDDGYTVVPGLVDGETLDSLRAEAARFACGEYPVANPPDLPADATEEDALASILAVHFPHWVSDVCRDAVVHPGVVEAVSMLAGAHLPHWDGSAKAMQTMLFLKPPGMPGQAWHQDERFIPTRDRSLLGAWIALDDADVDNGCLRVLPRSHRPGRLYPTAPHGSDEFDGADQAHGFDDHGEVAVEVSAGDVVFFNGYLLHRSKQNRSADRFRRALVIHYMTAASLLPWNITGGGVPEGESAATYDNRIVTLVSGVDPNAGAGYDELPTTTFLRHRDGFGTATRTERASIAGESSAKSHR
jgi:ectoine hydroxylase-related dioxygenase (phytanoyl-CoA dioxygenase family)